MARLNRTAALCAALLAGAVAGCSQNIETRGNLPLEEIIEEIKPGKQSREQIARMLGTPSTVANFEKQEIWYYIGRKTRTLAFFKPKVLEQKILVIRFDQKGRVQTIDRLDATDAKSVTLVRRVTPTKGKELGFIEQIIGNVGRFSNPDKDDD